MLRETNQTESKLIMTKLNETHITIDTTTPNLQIGEIQLSADRRTVKGQPELKDYERIRRVVLPAGTWNGIETTFNGNQIQSLTDAIQQAIKKLASDKLRDFLEENPLARTVPLTEFTIPAILAWSSETAASRNSLTVTKEQITDWYLTSKLAAAMKERSQGAYSLLQQRCEAMAANNHGLKTVEQALKMITLLADDGEHPVVIEMLGRLSAIERALTEKTKPTKVSLDDL
jgi:hypothetical protein